MPIEREPEGKYINANGLKLHYHEFGSGFPADLYPWCRSGRIGME